MKAFLFFVFIGCFFVSDAQKIEKWYDYKWKPCESNYARYLSIVEPADSVWKRTDYYVRERKLQMTGFYKDRDSKVKHGLFTYYHANGKPSSFGLYANDKKEGLWFDFHNNGMMQDSANYENGKPVGTRLGWFANGFMSDSIVYNADGTAVVVYWFDNGQLSSAGRTNNEKQQGKWQYFNREGKLSAEEVYDAGKLVSRMYYNEDGSAIADTTNRDREAVCKKNFMEYLSNNLYFPANTKIVNGDRATVVVNFTINEKGEIEDPFVYSSFHSLIDKIAVDVIKNSPKWIPAIDHNRLVKAYRRQPMTFMQEAD